jgi:glucan-binding YG repeat protein
MFNRANKITSLLVAVAAVVSIIPTGVSAASLKEVKSQKGEIYNAIAYKDGGFYIGGKPYSKNEAAYYLVDGKYSKLKDIDSEDDVEAYGTKYVEVKNGEYYLDLSTGKVTDDKIKEKELDSVSVNLRSKVKSDNNGRYDDDDAKTVKDLTKLPNNKFGEDWYSVGYKAKEIDQNVNGGANTFTVYTNNQGKYIDADYNLGKVKVKLSNGKSATVENTSDKYGEIRASVSDTKVIGQDTGNIYRLAKITVKAGTSGVTIKEINGVEASTEATSFAISSDKESVSFDVIQVISKAQASKEVEGIKCAKSTATYVISDKDGKKIDLLSNDENSFTVVDGKLINYNISGDEVEAELINLKAKSSVYYVETGDNDHAKLQDGQNSVDIDAEGNIWALSDSNIYKFDNNEDFEKIYSVDKEYNNLSVYDKDNIVVWNSDDNIYSIISKKAEVTTDEATGNTNTTPVVAPVTTTVTTGWVKDSNGKWIYNNADGTRYKGWLDNNGAKYYLDADGIMVTGWKQLDNNWYFLDGSGAMKIGWINDGGTWYYLNEAGVMLSNTVINGYKLGVNGAWIK